LPEVQAFHDNTRKAQIELEQLKEEHPEL